MKWLKSELTHPVSIFVSELQSDINNLFFLNDTWEGFVSGQRTFGAADGRAGLRAWVKRPRCTNQAAAPRRWQGCLSPSEGPFDSRRGGVGWACPSESTCWNNWNTKTYSFIPLGDDNMVLSRIFFCSRLGEKMEERRLSSSSSSLYLFFFFVLLLCSCWVMSCESSVLWVTFKPNINPVFFSTIVLQ